jgi:hypothetical protein
MVPTFTPALTVTPGAVTVTLTGMLAARQLMPATVRAITGIASFFMVLVSLCFQVHARTFRTALSTRECEPTARHRQKAPQNGTI